VLYPIWKADTSAVGGAVELFNLARVYVGACGNEPALRALDIAGVTAGHWPFKVYVHVQSPADCLKISASEV